MSALEAVLRRDRAVVVAALAIVTALAWADLVWLANDMWMGGMDMTGFRMIPAGQGWMMPVSAPWQPIEFGAVFVMWVVMMIGMMTPSVAPMILVYARIGRQTAGEGRPLCRERMVRPRLSAVVDRILACSDIRSMGAGACGAADPNDGERQ